MHIPSSTFKKERGSKLLFIFHLQPFLNGELKADCSNTTIKPVFNFADYYKIMRRKL